MNQTTGDLPDRKNSYSRRRSISEHGRRRGRSGIMIIAHSAWINLLLSLIRYMKVIQQKITMFGFVPIVSTISKRCFNGSSGLRNRAARITILYRSKDRVDECWRGDIPVMEPEITIMFLGMNDGFARELHNYLNIMRTFLYSIAL